MKKTIRMLSITLCTALMFVLLTACGGIRDTEASVTIEGDLAFGNNCLVPQIASMLGASNTASLKVEKGGYTLTKTFSCPQGDLGEAFNVTYTFTGTVSAAEGDSYTLEAPTGCTYDIKWGVVATLGEHLIPSAEGSGTQEDDPSCLNWFYGPYVADAGSVKGMTVTVKNGVLGFDGFDLTVDE